MSDVRFGEWAPAHGGLAVAVAQSDAWEARVYTRRDESGYTATVFRASRFTGRNGQWVQRSASAEQWRDVVRALARQLPYRTLAGTLRVMRAPCE